MQAIVALIEAILPSVGVSSANVMLISKIIAALVALIPIIKAEYQDLVPIVQRIIIALKADPSTIPAQLDALDAAEAQLDADYENAAAAAAAEDAVAAPTPPAST